MYYVSVSEKWISFLFENYFCSPANWAGGSKSFIIEGGFKLKDLKIIFWVLNGF